MNEKISLDDYDEFNEHTKEQMILIAEELNAMGLKYDTRLLAALMAGRSAMLHGNMISANVITQDEARVVWNQAGLMIETPPDREVKVMKLFDGEILNPESIN